MMSTMSGASELMVFGFVEVDGNDFRICCKYPCENHVCIVMSNY